MKKKLHLEILPQPDDTTCGPTCLQALYNYYGDDMELQRLIAEIQSLATGGTLAVLLACHALRRGYQALIYTYNVQIFDPTWFEGPGADIPQKLAEQAAAKADEKLKVATESYIEFFRLGGELRFEDLDTDLLRLYLERSIPILTGLSATYLYRSVREIENTNEDDDIGGAPVGHFVVLHRLNRRNGKILVADPYLLNPAFKSQYYELSPERVINSILLGILTYDANLLIIQPKKGVN